ncbi:MAG: hypothetical protein AB7F32_13805, partial [Victivallaceae bacterium]
GLVRSAEAPFSADPEEENRRLAERCAGFPGFVPLPAVHPAYGFWQQGHFAAAALYPSFHGYRLTSRAALAMARRLAAAGTLLVLVMREEDERGQHPLCKVKPPPAAEVARFAALLPEAKILVLNACWPEVMNLQEANLYSDCAMVEAFPALHGIPPERLVFGSHSPFLCPGAALAKVTGAAFPLRERLAFCRLRADSLLSEAIRARNSG